MQGSSSVLQAVLAAGLLAVAEANLAGVVLNATLSSDDTWTAFERLVKELSGDAEVQRMVDDARKDFAQETPLPQFQCPASNTVTDPGLTDSVHRLRPEDVRVIAAMGDSLTAANGAGAANILQVLNDYRGLSWSIGGDGSLAAGDVTLPNILKQYSPDLFGQSYGVVKRDGINSYLNVAKPGDISQGMPAQARDLVRRMKASALVDMENDWKVITIFVGGNNLCKYCKDEEKHSAANYVRGIKDALDYLRANVPRALVNLVTMLDITLVSELNKGALCVGLHLVMCPCGAFPQGIKQKMEQANREYVLGLADLVATGAYDTDTFAVVVQPFYQETRPPKVQRKWPLSGKTSDMSYFAPDCFHFSRKAHAAAATALWNNMLEPVGQKKHSWNIGERLECPSLTKPYFFTNKNSAPVQAGDRAARLGIGAEGPGLGTGLGQDLGQDLGHGLRADLRITEDVPAGADTDYQPNTAYTVGIAVVFLALVALLAVSAVYGYRHWSLRKYTNLEKVKLMESNVNNA